MGEQTREVKVLVTTSKGNQYEATISLRNGEKLHVDVRNENGNGITLYISPGGEACTTLEKARELRRD